KHGVHDVQSLFTTDDDNDAWSRYNINKIRFRKKICKGIPRPPAYIYERAKRILDINNHKGCFTAEEIELLKKLQRRHGNKWALIGAKMKRHRQALRDKFKEFKENRVTGPWTREERSALKNAVKEIAGTDDLHSVTKIPWLEVSKKVSTRTANQCRREWAHFLCWSESDRRSHVWKESDNAVLIE
ncbi:cyclin-D-binding Myb-like transcription factor 1, partial [Saccoglossus kowalevskii]